MTNYNGRFDEVLERYRLHADMAFSEVEDGLYTADEFKDVALPKVLDEAKQAITSLIKELVAEAKPKTMPSNLSPENYERCERVVNQYHQNLLKALEKL